MILGKARPTFLLYAALLVVVGSLILTFVWARSRKSVVPPPAAMHEKK